jgi:hypothetical protein
VIGVSGYSTARKLYTNQIPISVITFLVPAPEMKSLNPFLGAEYGSGRREKLGMGDGDSIAFMESQSPALKIRSTQLRAIQSPL